MLSGKNSQKAEEFSQIKDPVKFALAINNMEKQLTVSKRKPATQPEKRVNSSGPTGGGSDKELNRLRTEAEKTGDYSKVVQYKRSLSQNK